MPRAVQVQFRYAYVCDEEGVKVLDVTDLAKPVPVSADAAAGRPQHLPGPRPTPTSRPARTAW